MKTVNDCWIELRSCTTADELGEKIDNFPSWSGTWSMEVIDMDTVRVSNTYWDETLGDQFTDEEDFEVDLDSPEFNTICLGAGDYEIDMKLGTLIVDKSVFDDFVEGSIIRVHFPDENDEPTYEYQMTEEDDDYIYMDYFGD